MKKSKRFLSLLLAFIMSIGTFAGISTQVFAASEMSVYQIGLPRSADPNKSGWGHPALNYMNGWKTDASDGTTAKSVGTYESQTVYCIEPGVSLFTGDTLGGKDETFWDKYPSNLNNTIPPAIMRAYVGRILQYGWTGNNNLNWNSTNSTHAQEIAEMLATQTLIWETIVGERDSQFNHVNPASQGKDSICDTIASNHPLRSEIFSHYNRIENLVKKHTMLPSFFTRSSGSADTFELKWNGANYSATLTDTNNVLSNYRFSSSAAGLNFSVSGNKLTISTDKAIKGAVSITAEKTNGQRKGVVVWTDGDIGGGIQDLVTYGATVSDPITGYLNLEVKTGNMKLIKTSEDGKIEGIKFTITGNGVNITKTTNAQGEIDITDLNPDVYTVTEQAIDKYEPQAVQRVTIVSGQTSTVTFNNVLKRGSLKVTKTSEDGLAEGMKFHLYGTSLSGLTVDEYAVTDKNGIAKFENVLISGNAPYVLEEVDTPIRYVIPNAQNATINWKEVTNKTEKNILKKFRVVVTKSDIETGLPQGDATLAGQPMASLKVKIL